jgi:hypothetical protein
MPKCPARIFLTTSLIGLPLPQYGNVTNIHIGGSVKGGTLIVGDENDVKK